MLCILSLAQQGRSQVSLVWPCRCKGWRLFSVALLEFML